MARKQTAEALTATTLERYQVAAYIAEMVTDLARFATEQELSNLACFLEMAAIEADDQSVRSPTHRRKRPV